MVTVRKCLEKAWFSLLLLGFICIGVFRVLENPEKKFVRKNGIYREPEPERSLAKRTHGDWNNHVTKPLNLVRNDSSGLSDHILFFNRVPKSGSEMLVLLLQWLQGANGFHHVRLPGGERRSLSILQQEELVEEITQVERAEAIPISFDRHVYFVNFTKFDKQWPIYVNLVRDPVEKAISRFYYGRVTPNPNNPDIRYAIAKGLVTLKKNQVKVGNFEDCVLSADPECNFVSGNEYDLTIPYFCGQEPSCRLLNNNWALQKAKKNVEAFYPVVGVLEDLNSSLAVFEDKLPMFFRGVQNLYFNDLLEPHKNKNKWRPKSIDPSLRSHLKNQLRDEYDFYYWLRSRIRSQHDEIKRKSYFQR